MDVGSFIITTLQQVSRSYKVREDFPERMKTVTRFFMLFSFYRLRLFNKTDFTHKR